MEEKKLVKHKIEGFDQNRVAQLMELCDPGGDLKPIDCDDLVIIRWFIAFYEYADKDNEGFTWCSYDKILTELPLLRIDKKQLSRRIANLAGYMALEILNGKSWKGIKGWHTLMRPGTNLEYLTQPMDGNVYTYGQKSPEVWTKKSIPMDENVYTYGQKSPNKEYIPSNIPSNIPPSSSSSISSSPSKTKKEEGEKQIPTIDELKQYVSEQQYGSWFAADEFYDYNCMRGWIVKDWKAAARQWAAKRKPKTGKIQT